MNPIMWKNYQGALIPDIPPHHNVELSKDEQYELFSKRNPYFIRWTSDFDIPHESSFWYIIKDRQEGIETYNSKVRNQIKKGLRLCHVEKIDRCILIQEGYEVYCSAFDHYQTFQQPLDKQIFEESLSSLDASWEFWSVRNNVGKLIAYSQNHIVDNVCNYSTVKIHPEFFPLYPAYALFFTMNEHYLTMRKMTYIHDGARSLAHQSNIQSFLIQKFHFRKAYCHFHIVYRRDIAIIVKLLYPFRGIITLFSNSLFQKISVLLRHEEIRRTDG